MKYVSRISGILLCLLLAINFRAPFASALPTHPQIFALNPGYNIGGTPNSGEFIELYNPTGDESLDLSHYSLEYVNGSGNSSTIYMFPAGSRMSGRRLLLRLASSPEVVANNTPVSDDVYSTTLAMEAGPLSLLYSPPDASPVVVDSVCWKGADCYKKFSSSTPTTLRRCTTNSAIALCADGASFEHDSSYTPNYNSDLPGLTLPDPAIVLPTRQCFGLEFTEILSYYSSDPSEQFVEIHNLTGDDIRLDGCSILYKSKAYPLSSTLSGDQYLAYKNPELVLTKNPASSNRIELLDVTGDVVAMVEHLGGQKKSTSYALVDSVWRQTYAITPSAKNSYQEYRSCPDGKIINTSTGNCVSSPAPTEDLPDCPEGKYRNPETNRCKSIESTASAESCAEGYERNPETNRCRKIGNNNGADYPVTPLTFSDNSSFLAFGALATVIVAALAYLVFQFRREIANFFKKIFANHKK